MSRWRSAALGEGGRVGTAAAVLAGRIATDIAGYRSGGPRLHYCLIGVILRFGDFAFIWLDAVSEGLGAAAGCCAGADDKERLQMDLSANTTRLSNSHVTRACIFTHTAGTFNICAVKTGSREMYIGEDEGENPVKRGKHYCCGRERSCRLA